jgi:hypothetical protein
MNIRVSTITIENFCKQALVKVFEYGLTTIQEREEVAARWLTGDPRNHILVSGAKSLFPPALLAASLIDCEDSAFAPGGILPTKTYRDFFALIEMVDIARRPVGPAITADSTREIALWLVDKLKEPVDKSPKPVNNLSEPVDNFVDNLCITCGQIYPNSQVIHRFSNLPVPCG